jgi:hypothetical protein
MFGTINVGNPRAYRSMDAERKFVCLALLLAASHKASRLRFVGRQGGWDIAVEIAGQWHAYVPLEHVLTIGLTACEMARPGPIGLLLGREPGIQLRLGHRINLGARLELGNAREVCLALDSDQVIQDRATSLLEAYCKTNDRK